MAKYRKIESHIWRDAKFRSLDEGTQLLFFYLLTNPNLSMAGTLDMTIGMLSESLGKGRETVSKRFQNLLDNDMVEYDSVGLIWLKNFLRYNEPANSNMAKGICSAIEDLPECELLISIITSTTSYCSRFIEETHFDGYLKRLCKQFRNGSETVSKHIPNPVTETVTETETETEKGATSVASRSVVSKKNLSVPNPEGVEPDQWARYLKLRRDKHLPLTVEAFALLEREAKKAGLTTPQAIQLCLEHSWAGFKAEWMKNESSTQPESTVPTFGKVSAKQASFYGSKLAEIVHDKLPDRFRKGCQNWVDVANNIADAIMNDEQAFNGLIVPMLVKTGLAK